MCLFAADCDVMHEHVESWAEAQQSTLVTLSWEQIPRLVDELDEVVTGLAQAVLALYPQLYVTAAQRAKRATGKQTAGSPEPSPEEIVAKLPSVALHAARQIVGDSRASHPPTLKNLARNERVRQLALALDPKRLVIELLVHSIDGPESGALFAFGKGAEWVARNSGARVVLVLADAFASSRDLDGVYGTTARLQATGERPVPTAEHSGAANENALDTTVVDPVGDMPALQVRRDHSDTLGQSARAIVRSERQRSTTSAEGPAVSVGAVRGAPHPQSDAERMLHARIVADSELGPLFHYNQTIRTTLGSTPRVDLVWPDGKLVVEIDGHRDHSRAGKFILDRERDYELLLTGYRVMRMSDQHVLIDPQLTLERIRAAVRYLSQAGEPWASKPTPNKR